jgi:hypothetical protein
MHKQKISKRINNKNNKLKNLISQMHHNHNNNSNKILNRLVTFNPNRLITLSLHHQVILNPNHQILRRLNPTVLNQTLLLNPLQTVPRKQKRKEEREQGQCLRLYNNTKTNLRNLF